MGKGICAQDVASPSCTILIGSNGKREQVYDYCHPKGSVRRTDNVIMVIVTPKVLAATRRLPLAEMAREKQRSKCKTTDEKVKHSGGDTTQSASGLKILLRRFHGSEDQWLNG